MNVIFLFNSPDLHRVSHSLHWPTFALYIKYTIVYIITLLVWFAERADCEQRNDSTIPCD